MFDVHMVKLKTLLDEKQHEIEMINLQVETVNNQY